MNQTFDANGNLLTQTDPSGTTTYTWDARNRLVAINGPGINATFAYDALGRRISRTISGQTASFHYDGLDIVRQSGGAGEASYLRTVAIDEALTRTDANGIVSYLADILGSTVALADANAGPTTEYTYEPFGSTQVSGLPSLNPFQFTGRENDGIGLYYYRARHLGTIQTRFLSEDPFEVGAWHGNRYVYVENNPTIFRDPLGLQRLPMPIGPGYYGGGGGQTVGGAIGRVTGALVGGYYGGVVGLELGMTYGGLVGLGAGPLGSFPGAVVGGIVGSAVGGAAGAITGGLIGRTIGHQFDSPCAGILNCGEEEWLRQQREKEERQTPLNCPQP